MARHPWVAGADDGIRFGVQVFAPRGHQDPVTVILESARLVDSLGFDAFFLGDHPARSPDPWLLLGGVAMATGRVRLGSVVNCIFYRNPAYLARLAADLDQLSAGRLMLGLGIGWDEGEFRALSQPFLRVPARQAALEEGLAVIEGVWSEDPFTYHGHYFSVESMGIHPGPVQQPRPPLMIAGGGERTTLRQVARYADASNFGAQPVVGGAETLEDIRRKLDVLRQHCRDLGRPYEEILRTYFTGWLMMAPDESTLQAKLERYFPNGPSSRPASLVAGTPDQIMKHYQDRAGAGIQYFVVQILDCTDHETIELLANAVMPHVSQRT